MSSQVSDPSPQPTHRGSSSPWKWLVPVGCLVSIGIAAVVAFIVAIFVLVVGAMKSSWAYEEGLRLASTHPDVVASLGEPITPGWFVSGSIHFSDESGDADLSIPLRGPNGRGTLYVVALRSDDEWSMQRAQVEVKGQDDLIDLLARDGNADGLPLEADDPR